MSDGDVKHSDARSPLDHWCRVAKRATWFNFTEVKQTFNTADFVAEINFSRKVLFIRGVLTHKDYTKGARKP